MMGQSDIWIWTLVKSLTHVILIDFWLAKNLDSKSMQTEFWFHILIPFWWVLGFPFSLSYIYASYNILMDLYDLRNKDVGERMRF